MLAAMRRIRIPAEPSAPALELVDLLLGLRGAQARALLAAGAFFEIEDLDAATLYRIADESETEGLRVEFEPKLDAATICGEVESGPFVVRHREGEGRELVALIRELDPRLGTPDADEIIAKQGLVQIAVSRAAGEQALARYAALGGRAELQPLDRAWVALPGEAESDF